MHQIFAFLGFMAVAATTAVGQEPAWKKELTSPTPGSFPRLAPTTLELTLSWKGMIDSGKILMEFSPPGNKKPGVYVVKSTSRSLGAAATLFPYHSDFWSEVHLSSYRPHYFRSVEADSKESVTTDIHHFPDRVESAESTRLLKTGAIHKTDRTFTFTPVFDMFSAMLFVRSQKLDPGDRIVQVIHPFDTPYLLRVMVLGREVHNGRNTIKLSVGMQKIDRKTLELKPYKKLKSDAEMWLSDDADRIPVEFRAAVFIGDVRATLTAQRKP